VCHILCGSNLSEQMSLTLFVCLMTQ
jgi:hypothetical protein